MAENKRPPGDGEELCDAMRRYLALPVKEAERRAELEKMGVRKSDMNNRMLLAAALAGAAIEGDVRAGKLVLDLLDGGAPDKAEDGVQIVDDL